MATTLQMTDGTTTLDLNDGTKFTVLQDGFSAPPPVLKSMFTAVNNPFIAGSPVRRGAEWLHENRTLTLSLLVLGSSIDVLATNVQLLEAALRRAQEFSAFGWGAQTQLKLQWGSATNAVWFNVHTGLFDPIGDRSHNVQLIGSTRLVRRRLDLICEPYAVGAAESIENHLRDADFEVSGGSLSDWTAGTPAATGSDDRDSTRGPITTSSLKLDVTDAVTGGEMQGRYQQRTAAAADIWSVSAMLEASDMTAAIIFVLHVEFRDAAIALYESEDVIDTANAGTFQQMKLEALTAPTGTTLIRFWVQARATDVDANGTCYVGQCIAVKASTVPVAWTSSRELSNHFADDGQDAVAYLDIEDIPGDLPAQLQLFATEKQSHTKLWAGARHHTLQRDAGLWHDGEDFLDGVGSSLLDVSDASSSGAAYGDVAAWPTFDAATVDEDTNATTITQAHTCSTKPNRLLLVVAHSNDTASHTHNGVTYDGVAMTQVGSTITGANRQISLWKLVAPATGANNVVVTFSIAIDETAVHIISYYGVDQTTPVGAVVATSLTGTQSDLDVNVTTIVGGFGFGSVSMQGNDVELITPDGGEAERGESAAIRSQVQDQRATTTTTAMNWVNASAQARQWMGHCVGINPFAQTAAAPGVITKVIASPPSGTYRVLVRANEQGTAADGLLGIGYAYGGITVTPSVVSEYQSIVGGTFYVLDLGTLTIPPIETPENTASGSVTLRLAYYSAEASNYDDSVRIDWLMLMPIDFGSAYVSKTAGTDVVLIDSRSRVRSIALVNTAATPVVQSFPGAQGGDAPLAHPGGTRIYVHSDDGGGADIADQVFAQITYRPRFLSVAGT
jgi:hypothetical protein